jgi:hypothetical protein
MIFGAPLWMGVFMGVMTSFANSRAAMVGAWLAAAAAIGVGGIASTAPAYAQQVIPAALTTLEPTIVNEATSRLKLLAPIIRNSPQEYARLGYDTGTQQTCAAQTRIYAEKMVAFAKSDPTYSYAIAKADMRDLENMTRFATCTLPGGLEAMLNVCSTEGLALTGKLTPGVFDPNKIDIRPQESRCPGYKPVIVSMNNG